MKGSERMERKYAIEITTTTTTTIREAKQGKKS